MYILIYIHVYKVQLIMVRQASGLSAMRLGAYYPIVFFFLKIVIHRNRELTWNIILRIIPPFSVPVVQLFVGLPRSHRPQIT